MALPFEHWCFISYRHLDNKEEHRQWASWLHQEIEHYEVPAELVGTLNESGEPIPARIYPVFRDEDSLSADAHLGEEILAALRGSRTMLVICSPRSAVSTYVADEIKYFQGLGRGERIITSIIDGEPNDPKRECFPTPLRQVIKEGASINVNDGPLAADFRLADGTQGFTSIEAYRLTLIKADTPRKQMKAVVEKYEQRQQLMKLKILAGILHVSLEKLRDRDKAYQFTLAKLRTKALRRWLTLVGVLTVLSGLGTGAAYLQTKEAKTQKKNAESFAKEAHEQAGVAEREAENAKQQQTIAEANRKKADDSANEARAQEKIAIANREEADRETAIAKKHAYRAQIQLGSSLLQKRELATAREVLLKAEPRIRGWEWAYLLSRIGASPTGLDKISTSKWFTSSDIEDLRAAIKDAPRSDSFAERNRMQEKEILSGKRSAVSQSTGRGGSFSIVYQSDPPTQLFSYWLGMHSYPAKNAFSHDGTVLVWSGIYGIQRGRRANTSTGDVIIEDPCIAPLPNLLTLAMIGPREEKASTSSNPLLDPKLLPFGPMSLGRSNEEMLGCKVRFEPDKAVSFAFESINGRVKLIRDLSQTPIYFKDRLISASDRSDFPEEALIKLLRDRKIERKFCCWFDSGNERRAILEGNGLELWRVDGSENTPICPAAKLKAGTKDTISPDFWELTAVQIGKTRRVAGWLQSGEGRFLGIGSIDQGAVETFLLNGKGSKIPEEMAYSAQTWMTASPSGSRIYYALTGSNVPVFRIWDGKTGKLLYESEPTLPLGVGTDPDETFVAVVDEAGELTLRTDVDGKVLHRYPGIHVEPHFDLPVRRSPDGTRILISNLVIDATTHEDLLLLEPRTRISDDWNTAVSWVDGQTAEISSTAFWDALRGRSRGENLFLSERLLLSEVQRLDQARDSKPDQ